METSTRLNEQERKNARALSEYVLERASRIETMGTLADYVLRLLDETGEAAKDSISPLHT